MTDNEIIKALECLKGYALKCKDCLYSSKYAFPHCQQKVASDAHALINRQKAEIERLKMDNAQLQSNIINANMNCDHLLAEVEK